eukprot:scaffold424919_cov14-Prasinocladus_malaysianus.AAC.1
MLHQITYIAYIISESVDTRTYITAIATIAISIADRGFTGAAMSHDDDGDQCSSSHCHGVYTANVALLLGRLAQ